MLATRVTETKYLRIVVLDVAGLFSGLMMLLKSYLQIQGNSNLGTTPFENVRAQSRVKINKPL